MRNATDLLVQYAHYHRDRRNIASHLVGVPLIVFSLLMLLARWGAPVGEALVTPAWVVFALGAAWYLTRRNAALGVTVTISTGVLTLLAHAAAGVGGTGSWLGWSIGLFFIGWVIQFVGHWYEGKKPAFVDDLVGLLIGPMFVVAEVMFMLGWNVPLQREIERRAGPTVLRDAARIA